MLLKRNIYFRRHYVAHAEIISCGNTVLISRKGTRGQFLRLSGEKPQHNGSVQSKCHVLSSVMADYAPANRTTEWNVLPVGSNGNLRRRYKALTLGLAYNIV